MSVHAIVLAAGSGQRFGAKKQFLDLAGKPVVVHSLSLFQHSALIEEVICVVPKSDTVFAKKLVSEYGLSKVKVVLVGGATRQDSVANALDYLVSKKPIEDIVLVHDGARPLLSLSLLEALVTEAKKSGAVVAARPCSDSLKFVSSEGIIQHTLPREGLWAMQTPQIFTLAVLLEAYRKGAAEGFCATDEAMLVERLGVPIKCIVGPSENIKITNPSDLQLAESFLQQKQNGVLLS
ncbi:MAG: 2-C-methyl-D-erythritol 4-phosphate cytidylyltransferase [Nitrospirae bacterium]|nr:2-C-methyl-D-erythritol 4-phosphate cytidylyltransferase [Candidatus Manganitrophaceae bacterium]